MASTKPTAIDLFSGLGGFTLASQAAGFRTILQCEIDPFRMAGLRRAWPDIPKHDDVRTLNGEDYQGAGLLTAGVPCQPASRAGKQRGKRDDRWLWPATLAFIRSARPRWVLCENPPGINEVGLGDILAEMEALSYEIAPPVGIPACAVNAPHRRERIFILAHAEGQHRRAGPRLSQNWEESSLCTQGVLGNAELRRRGQIPVDVEDGWQASQPEWSTCRTCWLECHEPSGKVKLRPVPDRLPRLDDGISAGVRNKLVAALGDSVCVPLVTAILRVVRTVADSLTGDMTDATQANI